MTTTDVDADAHEIERVYGPWQRNTPTDAAALMVGYPKPWWIAGGWAIEAFTGVGRLHGDVDVAIARSEAAVLLAHVRGRLDVWSADGGTLRPLLESSATVPPSCSNLWLRADGASPWEYDVLLTDVEDGDWLLRHDPRIRLPLSEATWTAHDVRYLRPEVQLAVKAKACRRKDQADFEACRPLLDAASEQWLRAALENAHPGHAWIEQLR